MEIQQSRVYALADDAGRLIRIEGEYTLPSDLSGWVLVDEGEPCDKRNLAQSHFLPEPIMNEFGIYVYKIEGGKVVERTAEEIAADKEAIPPAPPATDELVNILLGAS